MIVAMAGMRDVIGIWEWVALKTDILATRERWDGGRSGVAKVWVFG
jgi:hypothetical protein